MWSYFSLSEIWLCERHLFFSCERFAFCQLGFSHNSLCYLESPFHISSPVVHPGFCNKVLQPGWLISNSNDFSQSWRPHGWGRAAGMEETHESLFLTEDHKLTWWSSCSRGVRELSEVPFVGGTNLFYGGPTLRIESLPFVMLLWVAKVSTSGCGGHTHSIRSTLQPSFSLMPLKCHLLWEDFPASLVSSWFQD